MCMHSLCFNQCKYAEQGEGRSIWLCMDRFIPLPPEGFSGRLYERQIPNLIHADALQQFLTKI